jgi:hypothetical protein
VRRYKYRVVVDAADEIAAAARTILRRYERFKENALLCFSDRLCFEGPFQSLSTRILGLR